MQQKFRRNQEQVQQAIEKVQREVVRSHEPWYRISWRARLLLGIYTLLLVLFALLAYYIHIHPILAIDVAITHEFQENQAPWLKVCMLAISFLGNQPVLFSALIILTALVFWIVQLRLEALLVVTLPAVSELVNFLLKLIVSRPRPTSKLVEVLQSASGQSFPSGHVMSYVAFWGLIFSLGIILLKRDRWWHYMFLIIPALLVVLVGTSRVYLGDHWASDVLGGYLLGGLLLGLTLWIYLKLQEQGFLALKRRDSHRI
ncbi:MAG TPA: phosphatase PAP2 family protein [Ktedonobacteraceae bacterium]